MKILVVCVDSLYDLSSLRKEYPDYAIYITASSENAAKVFEVIDSVDTVFYDPQIESEREYVEYACKHGKRIVNIAEN